MTCSSIIFRDETLVEDNVVIHTDRRTETGNRVIVEHVAMVHDAVIHVGALTLASFIFFETKIPI